MNENLPFFFLLFLTGVAFLFGAISWWSDNIDHDPCEKCGKKITLKKTERIGVYMRTGGRLDLIIETSYRCLNIKCKHARKETIRGPYVI